MITDLTDKELSREIRRVPDESKMNKRELIAYIRKLKQMIHNLQIQLRKLQ